MGNHKFKLSDMIPNAWFYKLKDMSRTRHQSPPPPKKKKQPPPQSLPKQPHLSHQRKSYYFTRELTPLPSDHITSYNNLAPSPEVSDTNFFPAPPRKSYKKRRTTKRNRPSNRPPPSTRIVSSSVSAGCSCRVTLEYPNSPPDSSSGHDSLWPEPGSDRGLSPDTFDGMISWSTSCGCHNDIIIDIGKEQFSDQFDKIDQKLDGFDIVSELDLPPIITEPANFTDMVQDMKKKETNEQSKLIRRSLSKFEEKNVHGNLSVKVIKEDIVKCSSKEHKNVPVRKYSVNSPGVKLRTNSPRIASRGFKGRKSVSSNPSSSSRRSLSESLAVVKSSQDPQKDFKESMMEMIVENNIQATKDLEDLLACYLSLNSDEYHELIIRVFKQIWFDVIDIRLE